MSVDESTVIFGPIFHVGWARASSTVTCGQLGRAVRPRNGPPLAVSTIRATPRSPLRVGPQALVHGAVLAVDRDQLGAGRVRDSGCTTGPAAISDSLLASASRRPARSVASVTGRPAKPTTPLTTTSASPATTRAHRRPPWRRAARRPASSSRAGVRRRRPPSAAARRPARRAGRPRTPRRARRPRTVGLGPDDVERLGSDRAGRPGDGDLHAQPPQAQPNGGMWRATGRSRRRAVRRGSRRSGRGCRRAGQERTEVLHAEISLDHRLDEIAEGGGDRDDDRHHEHLDEAHVATATRRNLDDQPGEHGGDPADHQTLDRLVGADPVDEWRRPAIEPPKYAPASHATVSTTANRKMALP